MYKNQSVLVTKMNYTWTVYLFVLVLIIKTTICLEDLLDEYVRHIDEINKVSTANNQRFRNNLEFSINNRIKFHQRLKKSLNLRRKRHTETANNDFNQWTHTEFLDKNKEVMLKWQPRHQEILFRVEAKTRGYVGIGFSPNGGMEGADIVLGWIDDRTSKAYLMVSKVLFYILFVRKFQNQDNRCRKQAQLDKFFY